MQTGSKFCHLQMQDLLWVDCTNPPSGQYVYETSVQRRQHCSPGWRSHIQERELRAGRAGAGGWAGHLSTTFTPGSAWPCGGDRICKRTSLSQDPVWTWYVTGSHSWGTPHMQLVASSEAAPPQDPSVQGSMAPIPGASW